jgi:predicted alpha/beta hydrolase family esterase
MIDYNKIMTNQVLFIHGAGKGAYREDLLLVQSLEKELGFGFDIHYSEMPDEDNAPYDLWKQKIQNDIAAAAEPIILVGHSIGASYLAKILTEIKVATSVLGVFLVAPPFWGGEGWLYEGYEALALPPDAAARFPKNTKVFLYQARTDEIVPFDHLALYANHFPRATVREIEKGGHQLNNDLSVVAKDIKELRQIEIK